MTQKGKISSQKLILAAMLILFLTGIVLAVLNTVRANKSLYAEHDKHLAELSSTVDHNICVVLNRCRTELSGFFEDDSFIGSERRFQNGADGGLLTKALKKSSLLLMDYADRIVVFKNGKAVLSTEDDDALDYTLPEESDNDDVRLCIDSKTGKNYIALSFSQQENSYIYSILFDFEPFFRRVVADSIFEGHLVVLYDNGSGLMLQNVENLPEYRIFTPAEIHKRSDGYRIIYEHDISGRIGAAEYTYTPGDGAERVMRVFVLPASVSENGIFTVAMSVEDNLISIPIRRLTVNSILIAVIISFSAAAAAFLLLHSGKRENELANEVASLEKEKQLSEELLKNYEQLAHHHKLETIGTLTAGISHEFNNLLAPIMGNSMLILEKTRESNQEIFDNALEIYEASDKAKQLVKQISKLSRKQSVIQMNPVLPEKLINDALSMSAFSIPENITVKKEINTDSYILGDEAQLGHMLLNLIINAIQAMTPDGGTLTLSVLSDGGNVSFSVSDTGKGIPEKNLEAIFDPFFTTKDPGKGTGLGLAIVQRTVSDHGGSITAENQTGGGAKFTFTLPIYKQSDSSNEDC